MSESKVLTCVSCPKGCEIKVEFEDEKIIEIIGNSCPQGEDYAREEIISPVRILPTTVKVINGILPIVPVKTTKAISLELVDQAMREISRVKVEAPIETGQILYQNLLDTGIDVVATRRIFAKER